MPQDRGILADETIRLSGVGAQEKCPHLLRRIEAVRADTGDTLVFLTNHHQLGASTNCDHASAGRYRTWSRCCA